MENMEKETKVVEKKKYVDPVGLAIYKDGFEKYQRLAEYSDLLPSFKDFYYERKKVNNKESATSILRVFNSEVCLSLNRKFHPDIDRVRGWRKKWDLDLIQVTGELDYEVTEKRNINQIIKTREGREVDNGELEHGIKTLGGELLNDAMQMLRNDQELEEIYDSDELMKRRSYIINVFSHATKLVHGKAALLLKASAEKRDTASFLMNLLSRATAGKVTEDEVIILKSAYAPKPQGYPKQNEPQSV